VQSRVWGRLVKSTTCPPAASVRCGRPSPWTRRPLLIDASGKMQSIRQVLQENEFYRTEVGKWTRDGVLIDFGRPFETSYFSRMKRVIWSYRYVEVTINY
jgi:hypothetical protein